MKKSPNKVEIISEVSSVEDIEFEYIESEIEDWQSSPPVYEISTYPADFTLEVLYKKWKAKDIEIPGYQRQFVWKQVQASKLIESFLLDLPVPPVYFYKERKSQRLQVIDGQQRLKSVFCFFDGIFGDKEKGDKEIFRLKGLSDKSKYHERTFQEFDPSDQRKLNDSVLRAFIVQQLDPNDDTSVYHIFERLNTGGTLLTNQEVRNCIYHGKFNDFLLDLNNDEDWRAILGKKNPDSRQKDVELILRFFALLNIDRYEKPMKEYLTKFMVANRNPKEEFLRKATDLFTAVCKVVVKNLGTKPFHIRAGLNSAVLDSVMCAVANNINHVPKDIDKRYRKLLSDNDYLESTSGATTDVEVVKNRFELANRILFKK